MDMNQPIAALFDLDGVILDTESQYTLFWQKQGQTHRPDIPQFEQRIKGMTLTQILHYFDADPNLPRHIQDALDAYEQQMDYPYITGVRPFIDALRQHGIRTAVVTSSNRMKMENVYRAHPEFPTLFNRIFTAEDFSRSKPDPDCYLLGARTFHTVPTRCVVFEDSFNGLTAGMHAGMTVVGLSTTNPADSIRSLSTIVIPDFTAFSVEKMLSIMGKSCE